MSFELTCPKCGAHSGPSVGTCPYCKTIMSAAAQNGAPMAPEMVAVQRYFDSGSIDQALTLASAAETHAPELLKNREFQVLYSRILIETEAPACKIRAILNQVLLKSPNDADATDYLGILDAKMNFTAHESSGGESRLTEILKRRKDLDLAYFVFGAHLFWERAETQMSVRHLDAAIRLRPNFLRAWGCLGAIHRQIGNEPLAQKAFQNCLRLETEPGMRKYFQELMAKH